MLDTNEALTSLTAAGLSAEQVLCEHADRCGGCPVIGLRYGEQLAIKRGRVVQAIARYASLEYVYTEPVAKASPIVEYRTRAKLIAAPSGHLGLFAKGGGHLVVDIPNCRVLSPPLAKVAGALRRMIAEHEQSGGPLAPLTPDGHGFLRAVDLRAIQNDGGESVLVTLVVQRKTADMDALSRAARLLREELPVIAGVGCNLHDGDLPQILGAQTVLLDGAEAALDRIGLSTHLATFGSFVQAHRNQTRAVHSLVAEALGLDRARAQGRRLRVLDLYGGSGAIALALAAEGADVFLVESFAPAVEHARLAAKAQGLSLQAEASDVATAVMALGKQKERFDAAVVNPPRRGMGPSAREGLSRIEPQLIVYVSCDPETLARDLDHLARLGYQAAQLRPVDMIPLTDEVETVAVLRRAPSPPPRVLFDDGGLLIVEKSAHEPVTPQAEYVGSLLGRVQRIPGAERAVALQRLDVGTTGLVAFARTPEDARQWDGVMNGEGTRRVFVAGTRGITPTKGAITRDLMEAGRLVPARTRYRRLAIAAGHSVLRVLAEHERPHQIRRHLASIGHPVLGDERYGHAPTNRFFEEKNSLDRTFLHCVRIEFDHPSTGSRLVVDAPLASDLRAVLERAGGPGTLRFLDQKNALGSSTTSSLPPPPPESSTERLSVLEMDPTGPSLYPENTSDED